MSSTADINAILTQFQNLATTLVGQANDEIQQAFNVLGDSSLYAYQPYEYNYPSMPIIGGIDFPVGPNVPIAPAIPKEPTLVDIGMNVPNPDFGSPPVDTSEQPTFTFPVAPSSSAPPSSFGATPTVGT